MLGVMKMSLPNLLIQLPKPDSAAKSVLHISIRGISSGNTRPELDIQLVVAGHVITVIDWNRLDIAVS